ncbi:hypothetical protein NE237_019949 [Protea cynaroides]|uniref:Uncharacterized protein n=1 Tax=Protea cynaroides TaxID=273540 RepID=A0A9Q0HA79_9MAGN|nr:hypothetical protein NE237_019949 [Protea cynaroides]
MKYRFLRGLVNDESIELALVLVMNWRKLVISWPRNVVHFHVLKPQVPLTSVGEESGRYKEGNGIDIIPGFSDAATRPATEKTKENDWEKKKNSHRNPNLEKRNPTVDLGPWTDQVDDLLDGMVGFNPDGHPLDGDIHQGVSISSIGSESLNSPNPNLICLKKPAVYNLNVFEALPTFLKTLG